MTRAEQAIENLEITAASGIVMVVDGFDRWLCRETEYDAAYDALDAKPASDADEGGADAYTELCGAVRGDVASLQGTSRGNWSQLAVEALRAGLIDIDICEQYHGVQLRGRVTDYQGGQSLEGEPSRELMDESLRAGQTGAVNAYRDAEGIWQYADPRDATRLGARTVWVELVS